MTTASQVKTQPRPWWLTLITGISVLIIGAVLLWAPAKTKVETYQVLVFFIGFYWLIEGIFDIVAIFIDHSMWAWKLFLGLISIVAGSYILMYPVAAGLALPRIFALVIGIWGLMYGFILLFMAFRGGGWGAAILGILGIIFGFVLIMNYTSPGTGLAMLWTAAVFGVIGGIGLIIQAFRMRSA
jgi:uncharacterized membrane protein HdeD (DUF308 family)